jgi:hypothetical protein
MISGDIRRDNRPAGFQQLKTRLPKAISRFAAIRAAISGFAFCPANSAFVLFLDLMKKQCGRKERKTARPV